MDEESHDKTTFVTREGTFRFRVMPFGLTGASNFSKTHGCCHEWVESRGLFSILG